MSPRGAESRGGARPVNEDDGRPEEYEVRATEDRGEGRGEPDVFLDVPMLNVEEIDLEVENLRARVSFQAELADLVKINVGIEAELGRVKLEVKGVEAKAQLRASLDNVRAIFSEVLGALDQNPRFFRDSPGPTQPSPPETGREALEAAQTAEDAAEDGAEDPAVEATQAARKKAEELGLDLSTLTGTGTGGRIVLRDVQRAARG